ncbi:MAG TPA: DUF4412 domain-containing protein [Chitinophagales bacterium]
MKRIILSISAFLLAFSAFAFEGEISIHYKGDAEKKEDYKITWHIANGKSRADFFMAATNSTTVILPQGGSKVQLYVVGANQFFNTAVTNIPTVEEYKANETTETKTIAGNICTKYIFKSFTGKTVESWVAKGVDVDWNSVPETIRMLPEIRIMAKYEIKGTPLETTIVDGGNIASQSNVISVKQGSQSAETFAVPVGFTDAAQAK